MSAEVTVRKRQAGRRAGLALLLAVGSTALGGAMLGAGLTAPAAPPLAWGVAARIPDLDAAAAALGSKGADGNPGGGVDLNAVSCTKPGYCTAGGDLYSGSDNEGDTEEGWVATETAGAWAAPKVIKIGSNGDFPDYVIVKAVSCASPGNCAAVGYDTEETEPEGYVDFAGAFMISQVNGTWSAPKQIPGTDALNNHSADGSYAMATSVSCAAPGDCAVTGGVNGSEQFVADETNGTWGTAELVPGFHQGTSVTQFGTMSSPPLVSCPKPGDCIFASSDTGTGTQAVTSVATEVNGVWGQAAPLPGFAAAGGAVTSLSCRAVGDCSAGGWTYAGKHTVPFVATEAGGTWTSAALPGFAALSPAAVDTGQVTSVACASPGNCSAGGTYRPSGSEVSVFFATETGGKWAAARPAGGVAKTARGIGGPSLSCPAPGDCAAVLSRAGAGYVALQSGGTWATARLVTGTTGSGGAVAVSCAAPGECAAGGNDHAGTEVWVLDRSASATTLTTVAPSSTSVAYGAEQAETIAVTVRATTPTPGGRVTVSVKGKAVCTVTLKNGAGACRLTPAQLKPGTYAVTAAYRGAAPYRASAAAAKTLKVTG